MRRSSIEQMLMALCFVMAMRAKAPASKPELELEKLAALASGRSSVNESITGANHSF